jgi:hypothetical protein
LLLCGVSLALAGTATAQPAPPAQAPSTVPSGVADGLPPGRIAAMVRAHGFDPMGRPARSGETYVLRALDPNDVVYRLVIDARTGRMVSMQAVAMPGPFEAAPYDGRRGPVFGRIFSGPGDNAGYGSPRPPRSVPHARPAPQQEATAAPPAQRDAAAAPAPQHDAGTPPKQDAAAPLPRPRPYVMEATGSIPVDAPASAPQKAPETPAPQKAPEPPKDNAGGNGGAAMPPIAPLD